MREIKDIPQSQLVSQAMENWSDVWRNVIPKTQRPTIPYSSYPPVSAGEGYASALSRLLEWLRDQGLG